jgi:hypothetical protein
MTADMYTTIPGIVMSVENAGEQRVNVQPTINMVSQDLLEVTERPAIINVPLAMPQSDLGGLSFPVQTGTPVLLQFTMRGLDVWKRGNGYPTTPSDRRKFDIRDCVAVPCVFPFGRSPNLPSNHTLAHDPRDVVLVMNLGEGNEAEIRIRSGSGDIEINAPQSNVKTVCKNATVDATEDVKITCQNFEVECTNYTVTADNMETTAGMYELTTGNYSLNVDNAGTNTSTGVFRFNGSFILNGVAHESHVHVETDSITLGPQAP